MKNKCSTGLQRSIQTMHAFLQDNLTPVDSRMLRIRRTNAKSRVNNLTTTGDNIIVHMACTSVYIDKLGGCSVNSNWNFVPINIIVLCIRMVNGALKPQTKLSRIASQVIDWLVQIINCTFTTCKSIIL